MGCIEVFVKLRTSAYQPVYFHPMKPMNASESDRIKKLEARVAALEENNWALRKTLSRVSLKERLYEKLRPKINRLQHYRPRKLDVPDSYRDVALPIEPPTFDIVTPSYNQASFIGATVG